MIEETNNVEYNPYIPEMYIIYKAPAKLSETTSSSSSGLHTNAFNTTIKSHTFENGVGTIEFDDSVTNIGNNAFRGCSSLTSITIPNSVTSIGGDAFLNCTSLPVVDNIRYADTCAVEAVDKTLSTYTIKEGTKFIHNFAFSNCTNLTSIAIPDSVTSIGGNAFSWCSFTNITIPNSVTTIGEGAFQYGRLTSITIPNSVTSISDSAFRYCISLTSVTIPNSITSIERYAFDSCSKLTNVTIPNSVTSIGESAFGGCTNLTSITIPNSVTSIGSSAFYRCTSLPVVDNIRYADTCAVEAVDKTLSAYTIKEGTRFIQNGAFSNCSRSLTSITIPNSVTSIGNNAFESCWGLVSVTVEATIPPTLGSLVFNYNASGRKIYVPAASVEIYKSASGWSAYASAIEAIPSA